MKNGPMADRDQDGEEASIDKDSPRPRALSTLLTSSKENNVYAKNPIATTSFLIHFYLLGIKVNQPPNRLAKRKFTIQYIIRSIPVITPVSHVHDRRYGQLGSPSPRSRKQARAQNQGVGLRDLQ